MMNGFPTSSASWSEIYNPGEKVEHMGVRWYSETSTSPGYYAHYQPYGSKSDEKMDFIESINSEHFLWNEEVQDKLADERGNVLYPRGAPVKIRGSVHFDEIGTFSEDTDIQTFMKIDGEDRTQRVSWITSTMLGEFVEKCPPKDRERFFDYGGGGRKFVKNSEKTEKILQRLEEIEKKMKDPEYKISLSDITVKDYPRYFFQFALRKLREYVKSGPTLRVTAPEFVPNFGNPDKKSTDLVRTSQKKICGVYLLNEKPQKPSGPPPQRRPSSREDSSSKLFWTMKAESDKRIKDLDKKLDLLIQMGGPVITAEKI